jgi:hypothetical protein
MDDRPRSRAVAGIVTYRGSWMFVLHAAFPIVLAGIAGAWAIRGSLVACVTSGWPAVFCGAVGSSYYRSHSRVVELHADGVLIVRYFLRPELVTRAEAVRSIERDDENGAWTISFERANFILSPNRSAAWLVHALLHRKPTILLSGYTIPPL